MKLKNILCALLILPVVLAFSACNTNKKFDISLDTDADYQAVQLADASSFFNEANFDTINGENYMMKGETEIQCKSGAETQTYSIKTISTSKKVETETEVVQTYVSNIEFTFLKENSTLMKEAKSSGTIEMVMVRTDYVDELVEDTFAVYYTYDALFANYATTQRIQGKFKTSDDSTPERISMDFAFVVMLAQSDVMMQYSFRLTEAYINALIHPDNATTFKSGVKNNQTKYKMALANDCLLDDSESIDMYLVFDKENNCIGQKINVVMDENSTFTYTILPLDESKMKLPDLDSFMDYDDANISIL